MKTQTIFLVLLALSLCGQSVVSAQVQMDVVEDEISEECVECYNIATFFEYLLLEDPSLDLSQFQKEFASFCQDLTIPEDKTECENSVTAQVASLFQLLSTGSSAENVCKTFCSPADWNMLLLEQQQEEEQQQQQQNEDAVLENALQTIFTVLDAQEDEDDACVFCLYSVFLADQLLEQGTPAPVVVSQMKMLCTAFPPEYLQNCTDMISMYGSRIVDALQAGEQPEEICSTNLELCAWDSADSFPSGFSFEFSSDSNSHPQSEPDYSDSFDQERLVSSDVAISSSDAELSSSGIEISVDSSDLSDPMCTYCLLTAGIAKQLLAQGTPPSVIVTQLRYYCYQLPPDQVDECKALVTTYGLQIVTSVQAGHSPHDACEHVHPHPLC